MEGHVKFLWLLMTMWAICFANARQYRINRYTTEVSDTAASDDSAYGYDDIDAIEIEAIVREIKLVPYPAAGYRPSKAFLLPNEIEERDLRDNESVTEENLSTSTVADGLDVTSTTTESETTTTTAINEPSNDDANEVVNAPYPAAGFKPKIPFNLPTENLLQEEQERKAKEENTEMETTERLDTTEESATITPLAEFTTPANIEEVDVKTPYPAAGFKPNIIFFLPNEDLFNDQAKSFRPEVSAVSQNKVIEGTTEGTTEEATTTTLTSTTLESVTRTPLADFTTPSTVETQAKTPYPPSGFKPKILFLLPTANLFKDQMDLTTKGETETSLQDSTTLRPQKDKKAPYPAAGFRPSKAFLLPSEQLKQEEKVEKNKKNEMPDNSKHPVCGSSTDPLAPKPLEGEKDDPDSETIFTRPLTVKVPARLALSPPSKLRS